MYDASLLLLIIACVDIAVILIAMSIFVLPFTCFSKCYPNEPAPRVVQLAHPSETELPFSLFVMNTIIHPDWYVSSISEYGGARGTTASKVLALATTSAGIFQFVLALALWFQGQAELSRFILLTLGGIACVMIGFAESAIIWKYGAMQQVKLFWTMMNTAQRQTEISTTIATLQSLMATSAVDLSKSEVAITVNTPSSQFSQWISELKIADVLMSIPPLAYMQFKQYQLTNGANKDILIYTGMDMDTQRVLVNDEYEKSVYANIHMASAILLIFTTFIAHIIDFNSTRNASFGLAIIGVAAFLIFCMIQFFSGNYNDSLPAWLTKLSPSWCSCPQMEPKSYGCWNKKALSLTFIFVEIIAFLSIVLATPVEGITSWYYATH